MRWLDSASLPGVLIADDLDVDSLAGGGEENTLDEVLVHPRLKLTHPFAPLVTGDKYPGGNTNQRVVLGCSGPPGGGGTADMSVAGGVPFGKDILAAWNLKVV